MDIPQPLAMISEDMMSGTPVFNGTRVPLRHLWDYLTTGETLDSFLEDFPTVSREQVLRLLQMGEQAAIAEAHEHSIG